MTPLPIDLADGVALTKILNLSDNEILSAYICVICG
jgi:hypothetical protein